MTLTKLNRTEGKGSVLVNGQNVVAIYEAQGQTVLRTSAGGENISFVVSEAAKDVVDHLRKAGCAFVELTRNKDDKPLYLNVSQIVGVYARPDGLTIVRTTAAREHAEYLVSETVNVIESKVGEANQPAMTARNSAVSVISDLLNSPKARRSAKAGAR